MPRFDERYIDEDFVPAAPAIAAKQAAENVGADTATVLTRRDVLKAQAAALRTSAVVDATVCDLFDALIAAAFDT
jgi:acetamidase/formamidase